MTSTTIHDILIPTLKIETRHSHLFGRTIWHRTRAGRRIYHRYTHGNMLCKRGEVLDQATPSTQGQSESVSKHATVCQAIEAGYTDLFRGVAVYVRKYEPTLAREEIQTHAEEVLQEAVAQALTKIDTFDPKRPPLNWVLGFAIKIILRERTNRRQNPISLDHKHVDQIIPFERFQDRDAHEWLELVSPQDQHVLRLALIEGLSGRELASQLGVDEGNARVRLYRAKQRLQRAIMRLP